VSEGPSLEGEWLTEDEYRAVGYSPDFDSLPVIVVERLGSFPLDIDSLPACDREFSRARAKDADRT
jgi:hypothetical protein